MIDSQRPVKRKVTVKMIDSPRPIKRKKKGKVIALFIISLIFVMLAASIAVVGCNYISNRTFKETFFSVSSLKVNNKIRVVQISDLHNSSFGKDNSDVIDRVQKLKPDLIIYTGDCIDTNSANNDRVLKLCSALAKVAPSYYIYGNNEVQRYYNDPLTQDSLDAKFGFTNETRDPQKLLEITDPFTQSLEQIGVKVLKNQFDTLTIGSTTVDVFGVLTSNPSSFWSYTGPNFDKYIFENTNNLKITAIHEPNLFEFYTPDSWGDLMLAGHNHGGIVKIPLIGPLYTHDGGFLPARSGHYVYGRYDVQGRPLIISSGLENKNFFRINNKPELVIIDITRF